MPERLRILIVADDRDRAEKIAALLRASGDAAGADIVIAGGDDPAGMAPQSALQAGEARFRALVENSSDALLLVDAGNRVTYMAPSASRHLGWSPDQMVGRPLTDFIHPQDVEEAQRRLAEARQRPGVRSPPRPVSATLTAAGASSKASA